MIARPAFLIDASGIRIAALDVVQTEGRYEGHVDFDAASEHLRQLFTEYEEVVDGQMFSLLDGLEKRVDGLRLRVLFDDGSESRAEDLQVYPSSGAVSFVASEPKRLAGDAQRPILVPKASDEDIIRQVALRNAAGRMNEVP
jgi:hypothetical protein